MQHSTSVKRGRGREIPFGVRALESGVEVDGVWISGTNTPASSMPGSPDISALRKHQHLQDQSPDGQSSNSDMSRLEIPQPTHGIPGVNQSSGPSPTLSTPFDRTMPAERRHHAPTTSDHQARGRATYQPRRSSHLRISNSFKPDDSEAFATLEGR